MAERRDVFRRAFEYLVDADRHVSADVSNIAQPKSDELSLAKFTWRLPHGAGCPNALSGTFKDLGASKAMFDHAAKGGASRLCNVQMDQRARRTRASQ